MTNPIPPAPNTKSITTISGMATSTPDFSSFTVHLQMTCAQHSSPWCPEQSRAAGADVRAAANTRVCYRVHSWTGSVKQPDELLQFSENMARISILRHYQLREQSFLFRLEQNGSHRALWWGINGLLLGRSTQLQVLDHFCTWKEGEAAATGDKVKYYGRTHLRPKK